MPEGMGYEGYDEINRTLEDQEAVARRQQQASEAKREQRALIEKWAEKLRRARKHDQGARERWADDRKWGRGDTDWLVDVNLIAAILEVLAAFLYAKNPDVSIRPSPSANKALLTEYRAVTDTLEIMVSRLFHDAGLKRTAKRWVRSAMTVGISWIKCAMQTRTERDPMTIKQINDLQDNLKRKESLEAQIEDGEADNEDATKAEIKSQIIALEAQLEREIAEGLVLDLMAPEDVIVAPECGEVENYLQSPWIAFDMYKDRDEALEITGWTGDDRERLKQANLYTQRPRRGEQDEGNGYVNSTQWVSLENEENEGAESADGFYRFIEIWSLRDGVVYTMIEGVLKTWARPQYAPRTGARFYPVFGLAFHPMDGERYPQSDVYQLKRLQDEYGRIRSNYAEHRRRAIPGIIFNELSVHEESVSRLANSQVQEYVGVKPMSPNADMRTLFAPKVYNNVDPNLYDTETILREMEKVSGAQEAAQGGIQVEKTATEAQFQESGRAARTGARLDSLEDCLTDMAEYTTQLILQVMDKTDAVRYAGPEAVWVEDLSVDDALTMFSIDIKAGSTGKPKALADREAWGTLMPLIEGMIDRVGSARMQNQEWAAKPWIALMDETSKRLDDPLEVEKFLPVVPEEVLQANANQEPSEKEKSETDLNKARMLKETATAIEKVPELFVKPGIAVVSEALDTGEVEQPAPAGEQLPPAPAPLSTEIN